MRRILTLLAASLLASAAPAQDSGVLLIGNKGEDTLSFVALEGGRELGRAATGKAPHEIAVSANGRQAAVVAYGGKSIDVFDIGTRRKVRTIDLGANEGPHGLVWLRDGRLVATTERSRSLTIVDPRSGDAVTAIPTDQEGTHMVAVSPDARRAYTANMQSASVTVIDLANGSKIGDVPLGGTPEGIALSTDGKTVWVADNDGARVLAFDAAALEQRAAERSPVANVSFTVRGGGVDETRKAVVQPLEAALRAIPGVTAVDTRLDGGAGWTSARFRAGTDAGGLDAAVMAAVQKAGPAFPKGRTEVAVRILGATPLATVPVGDTPIRVIASPDGRWIVTSNLGGGSLTVIDAATRKVARTIPVGGAREAGQVTILFSDDGRRLYAAETGRDEVAEVDFASGKVLRRLKGGKNGDGLALAP